VQLDSGKKEGSQEGYASGKNWAAELKRDIRSGRAKPNLVVLFGSSTNDADPSDLAMALDKLWARHRQANRKKPPAQ
jgi:hypothetical protein